MPIYIIHVSRINHCTIFFFLLVFLMMMLILFRRLFLLIHLIHQSGHAQSNANLMFASYFPYFRFIFLASIFLLTLVVMYLLYNIQPNYYPPKPLSLYHDITKAFINILKIPVLCNTPFLSRPFLPYWF